MSSAQLDVPQNARELFSGLWKDPLTFQKIFWPNIQLYDKQREVLLSIVENDETFVPAGNMLGKDFVASIAVLWFFLTRHPCRIVTTSAKADHLRVLWGEIGQRINESRIPMTVERGGPLRCTQLNITKFVGKYVCANCGNPHNSDIHLHTTKCRYVQGEKVGMEECELSYVTGMVASQDSIAAMQGHHIAKTGDGIPKTLFVPDECSSVPDTYYSMAATWMNRFLGIGNTWDCDNFWKYAIKGKPGTTDKGGDIPRPSGKGFERKVIQIKAEHSPNVRLGLLQKRNGKEPTDEMLVIGVKSYALYEKERRRLDAYRQCVSLDAEFYEGAEIKLFPPAWLDRAERIGNEWRGKPRKARAIGIDSGAGGDKTAWSVVDEHGVIKIISYPTPNTDVIYRTTLALADEFQLRDKPQQWLFDAGGGGKQHADRLREMGYNVRTVFFGEGATPSDRFKRTFATRSRAAKTDDAEVQTIYKNRRAEMFGLMSQLLDPENEGWGIPSMYMEAATELRRQLSYIPKWYDEEGRLYLPPKNRKPDTKIESQKVTLTELMGCSPDEADATALAVFGMIEPTTVVTAGAIV